MSLEFAENPRFVLNLVSLPFSSALLEPSAPPRSAVKDLEGVCHKSTFVLSISLLQVQLFSCVTSRISALSDFST